MQGKRYSTGIAGIIHLTLKKFKIKFLMLTKYLHILVKFVQNSLLRQIIVKIEMNAATTTIILISWLFQCSWLSPYFSKKKQSPTRMIAINKSIIIVFLVSCITLFQFEYILFYIICYLEEMSLSISEYFQVKIFSIYFNVCWVDFLLELRQENCKRSLVLL